MPSGAAFRLDRVIAAIGLASSIGGRNWLS